MRNGSNRARTLSVDPGFRRGDGIFQARIVIHRYVIGLGSNRRHGRYGGPQSVLAAALDALAAAGIVVETASPARASAPLGPGGRRYANAAAIVATTLEPPALLVLLKRIERAFGRRAARRWGPRVLDLDILLWTGGAWRRRTLTIPHPCLARRRFVLDPLVAIAPGWRLPGTALTARHLRARLLRPVDRRHARP